MIYIVSGDGPRCGSSMMMQGLEAGGMELARDIRADGVAHARARDGYHPNEDGLFELTLGDLLERGFPEPEKYDGKVIKVFPPPSGPLTHLVAGSYKVVWLHRSPKARLDSFNFFYRKHPLIAQEMLSLPEQQATAILRNMAAGAALEVVKARQDMDLIEHTFDETVDDPLSAFTMLADSGWPIDPAKAAVVVDPKRRRF